MGARRAADCVEEEKQQVEATAAKGCKEKKQQER